MNAARSSPILYVCDASAFGTRLADVLRAAGYVVAEVPTSMLASRVVASRPAAVVVDVDADGALEQVASVRKLPGSGAIDFVYIGAGAGPVRDETEAVDGGASAFFMRPAETVDLLRKIEALTGGPSPRAEARASTPPPSIARRTGDSKPPSSERVGSPSLPAPGLRTPGPPLPMSVSSLEGLVPLAVTGSSSDAPRSLPPFGTVSAELQALLAEAEARVEEAQSTEGIVTPEEEIEAVLPADVLASLDEPLDPDEDEAPAAEGPRLEGGHRVTTSGGSRRTTTGSGSRAGTGAGTQERKVTSSEAPAGRTASGATRKTTDASSYVGGGTGAGSNAGRSTSDAPEARIASATPPASLAPLRTTPASAPPFSSIAPFDVFPESLPVSPASPASPRVPPSPRKPATVLVSAVESRRFLGQALAQRRSGAVAFEQGGVIRRVVLRDGDMVTAASTSDAESLVQYLAARGELGREEARALAPKVAPFGRHAGAALVAHGLLGQDQLWNVLRAHAEWITSLVLRSPATAELEPEPPGRLRAEPSVFGAKAGPEVFVDLVRRATSPDQAIEALGGGASRIGDGANAALVTECALAPQEHELLARARGGTVSELLARSPDAEIVCVLHALALLGVVDIAEGLAPAATPSVSDEEVAALDDEAIRVRVRARLAVVDEGDYFAVLGIGRDATGYEVRHAYLELRRTFEPSRILTARTRDLADDVTKIIVVLDEAYEILRDPARRERYRRAIDARPA